ncbi:leucine-rich repeat-containing G-protein coupled receptor 6 [Callorhinchus milii]|uniref:leucine-rich repeat-containing G-protein coupled receptor 6 n=1 Tax=Callorhinchus milii TaxID=7868 RepID=UPI00045724B7|nr:leucine-rich repeat-containing G-protein coupled receptor 6 [Callorhinchus milii]|eukprot:gi/632953361/ref/XP_007892376.1/ PREDICTED: leucine-rich repeat-containing G-protein coupled receptor 6 [Callorhinchus milii]
MSLCCGFTLLLTALVGSASASLTCPAHCHCEEDGILLWVDCSELGLAILPENLSPLTSYLDLSMNNINELKPNAFGNLHFLEELRLSGNHLKRIPMHAFAGLYNLKVLMLQNNQLKRLPSETLWDLPNLQSLRLDANLISVIPQNSFEGLQSLRHLWLDDNALTEIPVRALNNLPSLQAMTLALNKITHISDDAFVNLSSLVVLHLHNNNIQSLGRNCFDGLHSLETLDLNYNDLSEFPVAIRTLSKLQELGFHNNNIKAIPEKAFVGNPLLQTIHFYDNPIQFVGKSAFQYLPKLHTLSLNGASEIKEFPDLKGTTSLEILTLTRAGITSLPRGLCQQLPNLRVLELSFNQIHELPSFHNCQKLEEIGLKHNRITEIRADTFQQLMTLRSLDLSWNKIAFIHLDAFASLRSLTKLDLTFNELSSLPLAGLSGLTHLKLKGNLGLSESYSEENFPKLRVLEMPYAYQCCAYRSCKPTYKQGSQWDAEDSASDNEDVQKRAMGLFAVQADSNYYLDMDDFLLDVEDAKMHLSIQCTPNPGPFKPCEYLFESWVIRIGVWAIVLISVVCNGLVITTIFASPTYLSPVKFVIGLIAAANLLTGLYNGILAIVDALTFAEFAKHGAKWETGLGCRITGFMSVFASEASILFLTLAAVQCSISVSCVRAYGKSPSFSSVKIAAFCCVALSFSAAALPLCSVGEFGTSPLCLPSPIPDGKPSTLGFMVALIMMNTLCFLVITGTYTKLYCDLMKGEFDSIWDCAMIKHVAWLIFTNCILYCPVAFLTFSSLLNLFLISPEVIKSILLVVLPLPACLNPLLYLLFNPHFKEDLRMLRECKWQKRYRSKEGSMDSLTSEDMDKQSCDSTLALMTFADNEMALDSTDNLGVLSSHHRAIASYPFPSVTLIPCQQRKGNGMEESYSTRHSCLTDEELLITSQMTERAHNNIQISIYPTKGPSFTSHV